MSQAPCWFALPLHHIKSPKRRAVIARRLGFREVDLDELLDESHSIGRPLVFEVGDLTSLDNVDGVTCLCYALKSADCAGEGEALVYREEKIPFLRWWHGCNDTYAAGAEVFSGIGETRLIRCDNDLLPLVGIIPKGNRYVVDAQELASANEYLQARAHTLGLDTARE